MTPDHNSRSPPRQQVLPTSESPVHAKKVNSSRTYQHGLLEDARLAVLEDLGTSIPEITLKAFMDSLAPPLPTFDLHATIKKLELADIPILAPSGRWTAFDKEPKDQDGREDIVFKPIANIFKKVVDAIIATTHLTEEGCLIDFLQNPNMAPKSADRHNATRCTIRHFLMPTCFYCVFLVAPRTCGAPLIHDFRPNASKMNCDCHT